MFYIIETEAGLPKQPVEQFMNQFWGDLEMCQQEARCRKKASPEKAMMILGFIHVEDRPSESP